MPNATFGLLICAALIAGSASAQTGAAGESGPAAAKPSAQAGKRATPTVSGVVVQGLPKKACSSRDKACIAIVVAQLEELYPKELLRFCTGREENLAWIQMHADDNLPATRAPTASEYSSPPVLKVACANVHKR